jgi:hypothetical protein
VAGSSSVSVPVPMPSTSGAKLPYREAVRDHSPGLLGLGFCHKQLALKGRPNAMVFGHRWQGLHFHPFPSVAPFRADLDGALALVSYPAGLLLIDQHRQQQDGAADEILIESIDIQEIHNVLGCPHDQHSDRYA